MPTVLIDIHALVWHLQASPQLSDAARNAMQSMIDSGEPVLVSVVSLVEIVYLEEKRRLPHGTFDRIAKHLQRSNSDLAIVPFDFAAADALRHVPVSAIPDMPDRMIAATAAQLNVPLITADAKIRAAPTHDIAVERQGAPEKGLKYPRSWPASAPALPRTAAAPGPTWNCWRQSPIPTTIATKNSWTGAVRLTQMPLMRKRQQKGFVGRGDNSFADRRLCDPRRGLLRQLIHHAEQLRNINRESR